LGRWVFDFLLELGAATGVTGAFTKTVKELATASVVVVAIEEHVWFEDRWMVAS
jgi:hypothetical protein